MHKFIIWKKDSHSMPSPGPLPCSQPLLHFQFACDTIVHGKGGGGESSADWLARTPIVRSVEVCGAAIPWYTPLWSLAVGSGG